MPGATWAIGSFLGGEISAFAQGRFDKPDYRFSMTSCLNGFPVEIGAWTRRPGSAYGGHTKAGAAGRVIGFDFDATVPVTLEFTDGNIRFRNGISLITVTAATAAVASISTANPAVVQLAAPSTNFASTNSVMFPNPSAPLLENRQFVITSIDSTHFSLKDPLTGLGIDGSTLGALAAGTTVSKIHEIFSPYAGGSWVTIRSVQAETTMFLLSPSVAPQSLIVSQLPLPGINPAFSGGAGGLGTDNVVFNDGPYLDPFINGVLATPSALVGIISLTLAFPAFDSTKAYAKGAFVTSGGINYISLQDQNVGNTPVSSPAFWVVSSASAAINNGRGFLGTDIGRLVRLLSEPPAWLVGSTYATGAVVSYNPSGQAGAAVYYQSLVSLNTGHIPGTDLVNWSLMPSSAAIWTWGKITSLSNAIDRALAGSINIGTLTNNGGVAGAFNGAFSQAATASAALIAAHNPGPVQQGTVFTLNGYVGKNYSGATAQKIQQATVYPCNDLGFAFGSYFIFGAIFFIPSITFNLRAKATAPASPADGTLLGTTGAISNTFSAVTILSSDQTTSWNFVWVEIVATFPIAVLPPGGGFGSATSIDYQIEIGQLSFFNPPGSGTGTGASVEILGPPLLYTNPIQTWRLGVYSNTTGWPTCGIYNDGRLFLGGAVGNRFDASVSNAINGGTVNFAPTDQFGVVAPSAAIAYVFNSDGVNQIEWMKQDLQGVLMGTKAGEWLVQAPTAGSISPTNITARNVTHHGSANVQPVSTEHTTAFVQRYARKLLEYFPDVYSGKFTAPNLADKTVRTRAGIVELAYTSAVTPIIWGRDASGGLFGITYKRDTLSTATGPTFYAWHGHTLGSGRAVESICVGPSIGGDLDALTMVTSDGSTRHVEVLTDTQDEQTPLAASWYLDDAITPSSITHTAAAATLNGLWHLNGKTVQVFAGGLDLGDPGEGKPFADFLVTNGSLMVPFGDGISAGAGRGKFTAAFLATNPPIVVGFNFTSEGQTVRPITQPDSGARNGPAFAKLTRGHRFGMKLVNTLGLSVGGDLTQPMYPCAFKKGDGITNLDPFTTFSGIQQDALRDDYGYEGGKVAWRITRPWPANIVAIGDNLMTQDQ
jgi:hypothetical protein